MWYVGRAQNGTQFFVSEKPDEVNSLKKSGEPGEDSNLQPAD
jgi:hypothetical protein